MMGTCDNKEKRQEENIREKQQDNRRDKPARKELNLTRQTKVASMHIKPFDDAYFEARRGQFKLGEPKDLVCQSNNKVMRMCIKSSCPSTSLICEQKECSPCRDHQKCPKIDLEGVTQSINKHNSTQRYIAEQVAAIEDKFFISLREASSRLGEELRFAGLGERERERRVAEEIYDRGNANCLKGKEAAEFYQAVEELEEHRPSTETIQKLLGQYDQALQKALATAAEVRQLLCSQLSPKVRQEIDLRKNINSIAFDSKILSLSEGHAEALSSILGEERRVQRVERLFRASEHGFSAKAFHQNCDNREDTLVLVRTRFGKTIGGYTHYPWTSHGSGEYVNDSGRRAFLFSLDMREKFVPQRDDQLILRHSSYGPTFGGGRDMCISDGCNSNSSSYANFPSTYNRAGENKLAKNKDTWRMFSGGDTSSFRVIEYEVFRVWYS